MSWNSIFGGGAAGTAKDPNYGVYTPTGSQYANTLRQDINQLPSYPISATSIKDPIEYRDWRLQAIHMRMQRGDGTQLPFDGIETLLGDDLVYILIVVNGKGVMLEDDRGLFPSDTLLTQLRLLAK